MQNTESRTKNKEYRTQNTHTIQNTEYILTDLRIQQMQTIQRLELQTHELKLGDTCLYKKKV